MTDHVPPSSFAEVLDEAIRSSGVSVTGLRRRLTALGSPVSAAALRSWRTGKRRPEHARSLDAVDNLEEVLGLDAGSLSSRLGPSRRLRRSPHLAHDELVGVPGALAPLLEAIGCAGLDELESIGGTAVVDIGADRRVRAASNRMLWRARRDGARRAYLVLALDGPTGRAPSSYAVGASLGRSAFDRASGLAAWEVVLPRPLLVGETTMIDWICDDVADDAVATHMEGYADRRVDEGGIWLRFAGEVPSHIELFEDSDMGYSSRVAHPTGASIEHHVRDFGPGVFGFRWEW